MENHTAASQETASLVKRLAGPSTGKAGLCKDQTEINRVIAEASKGSKFYENEKKKDRDLTERINKILKQRDDVLKGVDIDKINSSVDHMLVEIESQRDLSQTIVHVDMDAFFASVELLHNPALEGKPFGVGYGVLTTASYEARRYGVRSGMPGFIAKKLCPDLVLVPNIFSRYQDMSEKVMSIFQRYDPDMAPAGCDEGYLNITQYCKEHGLSAGACVQEMRKAVYEETKLTVSAGIAPNKMLAKICSDKNKPNGQYQLPFDNKAIVVFMRDLSIRKVPGIGRVNERLLESIGIKTCGDIFTHRSTVYLMDKQFGLRFLLRTHLGIASNVVQAYQREERKSIGAERTFPPLEDRERILQKLDEVAVELQKDMDGDGWAGRTVTLKYKLDTYQVFTRAKSFDRLVTKREDLFATGKELLIPELPLKLRLIGLRVTKLKDLRNPSTDSGIKRFFEPIKNEPPMKRRKLEHADPAPPTVEDDLGQGPNSDRDEFEEAMPGFHEHDERDNPMSQADVDDDEIPGVMARTSPTNPASGPDRLISSNSAKSRAPEAVPPAPPELRPQPSIKLHSTMLPVLSDRSVEKPNTTPVAESHDCPVCGKTLATDNQGINSHIDFCLSREAIREAQVEASSPVERPRPSLPRNRWLKPNQDGGRPTGSRIPKKARQ